MNDDDATPHRRTMMRHANRKPTMIRRGRIIVFWICFMLAAPAFGGGSEDADRRLTFSAGDAWTLALFPAGDLYPSYIADPLRPGFAMMRMDMRESEIPGAGSGRYAFMLGGQYGLLKLRHARFPDMAVQLDIYGAFLGQFDLDNSADNIGWDGLYGFMFTWTNGGGLALKLAMQHDSSHVGDEYAERTGRRRINYTREEAVFGASYRFPEYVRIYGETGYGHDLRNPDLQEPWRVKGGVEFEDPDRFFKGRVGWYAALDLSFAEETDWDADVTAQAGFVIPVQRFFRTVRIGPVYRNGRSLIGEFFQRHEEWWGLGLWIDM